MNKIKKIIIILVILIVITSGILIYFMNINKKQKEELNENNTDNGNAELIESSYEVQKAFSKIDTQKRNKYFAVENIVNSYVSILKQCNGIIGEQKYNDIAVNEQGADRLLNLLDNSYKQEFNITKNYVLNNQLSYNNYELNIDNIYISEVSEAINLFIVEGTIDNENINLMIKTDNNNMTFSIFPEEYMNKNNYNIDMPEENIKIDNSEITANADNTFNYTNITDQYVMQKIVQNYNYYINNNINKAYDLLQNEYKQKKFPVIEYFNDYIDNNRDILKNIEISKYKINNYDEYTEYICMDKYENYYIFEEKSVMDYTVKLDSYTVASDYLMSNYSKSTVQEKAQYDIGKVIEALNKKDYEYVYSKLKESDKTIHYQTYDIFENAVKNKFYNINKIQYGSSSENENNSYKCNTYITDYYDEDENGFELEFTVNLKDNNDYEISFIMNN